MLKVFPFVKKACKNFPHSEQQNMAGHCLAWWFDVVVASFVA